MQLSSAAIRAGLAAARERAGEMRFRDGAAVAVVDPAGILIALERPVSAPLLAGVCEAKAVTSAAMAAPTAVLAAIETQWPRLANPLAGRLGERFSAYPGGHPIRDGEVLLGAIGVSGGTPEQDGELASHVVEVIVGFLREG